MASRENVMMKPLEEAMAVIVEVMREGAAIHPQNDWLQRDAEYHVGRAELHLRLLREGDQRENHLSHAATRLLMALALRETS